jgi:hypothetical protein
MWTSACATWGNAPTAPTVMLTGTYQLDGEVSRRLLRALPTLLVLRATPGTARSSALLADEIVKDDPGQEAVLDRLLDLLLIAVLRAWFARPEADAPAWYRAYGDPVVGRALRVLAPQPARTRGRWPRWRTRPACRARRWRGASTTSSASRRWPSSPLAHRARPPTCCASPAPPSARWPTRSATAVRSPSARPSSACAA